MARVVTFNGKKCVEPGAYATTVYTPTSVVNVAEFGNTMIIDTGNDPNYTRSKEDWAKLGVVLPDGVDHLEFSGGSGIIGGLAKAGKSIYQFTEIEDFVGFTGGGEIAAIAEKLFTPRQGVVGAPKVLYVRAATTTPATASVTVGVGGSVELKCKNEGVVGNAVVTADGILKAGYQVRISGDATNGFTIQALKGNFGGYDSAGDLITGYSWEKASGIVLTESPSFKVGDSTVELASWLANDSVMNAIFDVSNIMLPGEFGAITAGFIDLEGGTTTYLSEKAMSDVFDAIEEMDISFFLCTNMSVEKATDSVTNAAIFTYVKTQAKYGSILVVPAGGDSDDLLGVANTSQGAAVFYNDAKAVIVHGYPETSRRDDPSKTKVLPSVYLAAAVVGLNAGMEAQTPLTFKAVGYNSFSYDLKQRERVSALQAGILHVRNVNGTWCVNQGITSLQENLQTYDSTGNSIELSIELIKAQVNKELVKEAEIRFTGNTVAQASPESVKNFVETKLASLVAETGADNLIISWQNVKVRSENSTYFVTYDFIPNIPVNKLFFIGNILDFTFSA